MKSLSILITGSTDGIGKLAAEQLIAQGHTVYLHGRNKAKMESLISTLQSEHSSTTFQGFIGDLSQPEEIRQLATMVSTQVPNLDVLIHNAGVYKSAERTNSQGIDLRYMVNYIAPVVLTSAWAGLLSRSQHRRLINLSSAAQAPVSLEALQGRSSLTNSEAYAQSKLALTSWSFQIGADNTDWSVVALNPGSLLDTKMAREAFDQSWSEATKGSEKICELALATELQDSPYAYYDNDAPGYGRAHPDAYVEQKREQLATSTRQIISDLGL